MVKIAFHDNQLCERGTTVSLYDYAYYNKHYLGNESIIMYDVNDHRNIDSVIEKFKKEFTLRPYNNWQQEADKILKEEKCDILYMIKAGEWDGKMADKTICKSVIHCVFNTQNNHGDVYATIAPWVHGNNGKYPFVPHMINLPEHQMDMRKELHIPDNATVFGRYGGYEQFNIPYVSKLVFEIAKNNPHIYFVFCNTKKFCDTLSNIIHIEKIIELEQKVEFINTCDAMLWARPDGEVYSLSMGEFSIKNKPIICTNIGYPGHVHKLGKQALWYNNENDLRNILLNFNRTETKKLDWNAYKDDTMEKVMDKFNEVFIKPCLPKVDSKSFINHNNDYILNDALQKEINIHKEKTKSAIEKNGGMWDNLYKPGHLHGNWLDNNTQIISSVDIGSGTGWFVNYLKDKYNFKTIYGIEPSEAAIKIAKTIYQDNTNINYLTGYAEECLKKINVNEPTLFTTSIVLSHIEDNSVIQILKEMNKVAPVDSMFIFNENYDNTFHNNMWHCRTREWWESKLPDWDIQYDERPRPDLQVYKQGLMEKKVK